MQANALHACLKGTQSDFDNLVAKTSHDEVLVTARVLRSTLGPRAAGAGAPVRVRPGQGCPPPCRPQHARFWLRCDAGAEPSIRAADAFGVCIFVRQISVKVCLLLQDL